MLTCASVVDMCWVIVGCSASRCYDAASVLTCWLGRLDVGVMLPDEGLEWNFSGSLGHGGTGTTLAISGLRLLVVAGVLACSR